MKKKADKQADVLSPAAAAAGDAITPASSSRKSKLLSSAVTKTRITTYKGIAICISKRHII